MVPTALRKLWAVRCPRRLHAFCRRPKTHFATCFQAAGSVDGSYCPEEALGSALSEAPANMRFAGAPKRILQLAFKQLDLLNFRTCGLKTQVFRTRVQDVETRVPGSLS